MPIERSPGVTKIIYPARTQYLDANRAVIGEIYVDVDGIWHVGTPTAGGGTIGSASIHGLNDTSIHTGALDDNQAPQFLKRDGTRMMTGNLAMGGNSITGVANITATGILTVPNAGLHVLDTNASHDLIITPGSDLTADRIFTLTTGDAARTLDLGGNLTVGATTSITGGGTLALGGFTLTVPATGTVVLTSRTITSGDGLTGGGDLSANRTLAVGAGDGIDVAADSIAVDVTDILGSGLTESANNIDLAWGTPTIDTIEPDDTANAGASTNPARSDHRHAIVAAVAGAIQPDAAAAEGTATSFARSDHQHAIVAAAASTLTVASTNTEGNATSFARSNHTHAITTSTNPGANARILASSVSGRLELEGLGIGASPTGQEVRIDGNIVFVGAHTISTTIDSLTLAPAADLDLTPGGTARVRMTSGVRIQSDNYTSQLTGWGISYSGAGDFRYLYADEMHVKSFIADLEQALAGGQIICKSVAPLAADFTVPAPAGAAALYVEEFKGFDSMRVFVDGDIVRLRQFERANYSLAITNCWGTVVYHSRDDDTKIQRYTFTRSSAPNAGAATNGSTIGQGTLALDYGTTGNGFYEVSAIDGIMAENSPYAQIVTWTTHPATGLALRSRYGNLKGVFNHPTIQEYGFYAGDGVTDADKFLRISNAAIEAHNLPIKVYEGANTVYYVNPDVPSYALGSSVPTDFDAGTGVWAGKHGGVYKWRVGDPSGIHTQWDGAALDIYDDSNVVRFRVDADGAWLSNLAISEEFGQQYFTRAGGLLLLGPGCPLVPGSWQSLRGQAATLTGAFHTVNGRWPGTRALMVEKATTNMVTNPSFEIDLTGWAQYGAHATSGSRSTDGAFVGIASMQITRQAGDGHEGRFYTLPVVNGEVYTISVSGHPGVGAADPRLWIAGDVGEASVVIELGMDWPRTSITVTANANGNALVRVVSLSGAFGASFYVDGVQAEHLIASTSYIDGSLAWGAWTGAAHASTSARTATEINLDDYSRILNSNNTWSIRVVAQAPYAFDDTWPSATDNRLWQIGAVTIRYNPSTGCFNVHIVDNWYLTSSVQSFSAGDWLDIILTLDFAEDKYFLYVNGVEVGSATTALTAPAVTTWNVGSAAPVGNRWGGAIAEHAAFDSVLTATEVAAIYQSGAPLIDQGATDTPGIYILDGKFQFATSTSGQRIEITAAEVAGYDSAGTKQFYLQSSDGKAYAGAGAVVLSSAGINIYGTANALTTRATVAGTIQCSVNAAGAIVAGAGAVVLNAAGINIYGTANALTTRATVAGTIQCSVNAAGAITAGAGAVVLDVNGITIATGPEPSNAITWKSGATSVAKIWGFEDGGTTTLRIYALDPTLEEDYSSIFLAAGGSGALHDAAITLRSQYTGAVANTSFSIGGALRVNIEYNTIEFYCPIILDAVTADPTDDVKDGMLIYRSDTDKFRGRANGAWVDLN